MVQKDGTQVWMSKKTLKVPGKRAPPPSMLPQQGPHAEIGFISTANGLIVHLYVTESPKTELFHENRERIRSPSMEPHADGRLTYSGVRPRSPRGSFSALLSQPQCHEAAA